MEEVRKGRKRRAKKMRETHRQALKACADGSFRQLVQPLAAPAGMDLAGIVVVVGVEVGVCMAIRA